jgi:putative ABC transport system substrate-binding protein
MRRREFITLVGGAAATWPLAARGQQPAMPVIGFLASPKPRPNRLAAFRRGLREAGYIEGQNVAVEFQATDQNDRLPALADDLVRRRVAVLMVLGNYAILAAKAATSTIPIVFSGGFDPVELGVVANLARPGGNITGASWLANALEAKRLGLIRVLLPRVTVIAALINPDNASAEGQSRDLTEAAHTIGLRVVVANARSERDFDSALAAVVQQGAGALVVVTDGFFNTWREHLVALVARHAIPAIYFSREIAEAGGLMSYGATSTDADQQAGLYVGRILKGEKPADLPVMLPTRFELVINLKTAKALGLTVPDGLLLAADEVIE